MRKITSLFALLLLFAVTATAQTSVYLANTAGGSLPTAAGFGTFSGQTFTTAAGSGLAGVTLTASSGLTIGEQQVNVANYGYCFRFVTAAAATDYTVTLSAPDGYVITGYYLACSANTKNAVHTLTSEDGTVSVVASAPVYNTPQGPKDFTVTGLSAQTTSFTINTANSGNTLYVPTFTVTVQKEGATYVDVTYELYESDGTTLVSSEVVSQEANSAVNVPSSLTASTYFDYATSGTIGDTDCTITVTRTLKAGIIGDLASLSNNKAYTIVCERGALSTYDGAYLANTVKTTLGVSAKNFAILNNAGSYYLYSVDDAMFVQTDGSLSAYPTDAVTVPTATATYPLFKFFFGSLMLNSTSGKTYGVAIDSWTTEDAGNCFLITEAADFDPTEALARFADRTPYYEALNDVITAAQAMPFGNTVNTYVQSSDYTTALAAAQNTYADTDATIDELTEAATDLAAALYTCTLNLPEAGYYRIKGETSGMYLASGLASNNKYAMSSATDASTIFYFDGSKLINFGSGLTNGMGSNSWSWVYGTANGSTVTFVDAQTLTGTYGIQSVNSTNLATYFYDNGDGTGSADRGTNVSFPTTTTRYALWTLEEVTELPFTISAAGQATLSLPTAWEVPAGVTVRYASVEHDGLLTVEDATATAIAADEAVILVGTPGDYTITLAASGETLGSILTSTNNGGVSVPAETKAYILALNGENQVVFSLLNDSDRNIAGFKAYYISTAAGEAPAFFLLDEGEVTGINAVNAAAQNGAAVYDLQGRRVSNAQKGVYIINGQKVLVK